MSTPEKVRLELDRARLCLEHALDMIEELDGLQLADDQMSNNAQTAVVSRNLLRLAELCRLAGAEVYQQYWQFKGFNDPRK